MKRPPAIPIDFDSFDDETDERVEISEGGNAVKAIMPYGLAYLNRPVNPKKKNIYKFKLQTSERVEFGIWNVKIHEMKDGTKWYEYLHAWRWKPVTGQKYSLDNEYEEFTDMIPQKGDVIKMVVNGDKLAFWIN